VPPRAAASVLAAFLASRAVVVAGLLSGSRFLTPHTPADAWHPATAFLAPFFNWDANYYMQIATYAYLPAPDPIHTAAYRAAFFPLFPFLVSVVGHVLGDPSWSALLISNIAFLLALLAVRSLGHRLLDDRRANATVWVLAFYPWSLFLSLPYTEVLLILFFAIALRLADDGRWLWAGAAGAAAAMTRAPGLLSATIPLAELARSWFAQRPRTGLAILVVAAGIPALGWVAVGFVQLVQMGDPLGFVHGQSLWIAPHRNPFFLAGTMVTIALRRDFTNPEFFGLPALLCFAASAVWMVRRLPRHYTALAVAVIALSLFQTLYLRQAISLPRYLMVAVPCYFAFGSFFARFPSWVLPIWLVLSGGLLFWLSVLFATWRFVG
jgi:hypothetical protein